VLRYYYADLPVAEVAALMGCAPGTVKHSLVRR
jgi:DNA-directed RNA polymerase specialized sigma24 family protein